MYTQHNIIIAGSTGLIGALLVGEALKHEQIGSVVSLSRHALKQNLTGSSNNLMQIISPDLHIDEKLLTSGRPTIGFIALGSTKKKAGSNSALKAVDVTLVVNVAHAMKQAGIKSIYVVSCIGASETALSHYLQYKGEMERLVEAIGFEQIVFIQPGPLAGKRELQRLDERLLQGMMLLLSPIMKGRLLNYKPIEAELVAQTMLHLALKKHGDNAIKRVSSQAMFTLQSSL
jgi:uncharacterized protein YbjT (DUF2867 family)